MYVKTVYGYTLSEPVSKGLLDTYDPPTAESRHFLNWIAMLDLSTCQDCRSRHGQIYPRNEPPEKKPPLHLNCRCEIKPMEAVKAGEGTKDGENGADWWIKYHGALPDYYITEEELAALGWRRGKPPAKFAPGKMLTVGIYNNLNTHLPHIPGRIWYEADINYYSGRRNGHRLLWSNDGLMFVTYDHYETFLEII